MTALVTSAVTLVTVLLSLFSMDSMLGLWRVRARVRVRVRAMEG